MFWVQYPTLHELIKVIFNNCSMLMVSTHFFDFSFQNANQMEVNRNHVNRSILRETKSTTLPTKMKLTSGWPLTWCYPISSVLGHPPSPNGTVTLTRDAAPVLDAPVMRKITKLVVQNLSHPILRTPDYLAFGNTQQTPKQTSHAPVNFTSDSHRWTLTPNRWVAL